MSLKARLGRAAIAALILLTGVVIGGVWGFGQPSGPLKVLLVFGAIAILVDRLISKANRKGSDQDTT
jgi:hypothetical protein